MQQVGVKIVRERKISNIELFKDLPWFVGLTEHCTVCSDQDCISPKHILVGSLPKKSVLLNLYLYISLYSVVCPKFGQCVQSSDIYLSS